MTGWGQSFWGTGVWGGDGVLGTTDPPFPPGDTPILVVRYPYARQVDVAEDTQFAIGIFDANYNLDTAFTTIYVDGLVVYQGSVGFDATYTGRTTYVAGTSRIVFTRRTGFRYGQRVKIRVLTRDTNLNYLDDTWEFTVRVDPTCYTGLTPLSIELSLRDPYTLFLALEPLRELMFNNVLRIQSTSTDQTVNKAARAIYQLAYATELSTLQNPYGTLDSAALTTKVCEKQTVISVDLALSKQRIDIVNAIGSFKTLGVLDEAYSKIFHDYLDSSLYLYRVSLVANMLLFAKSYELAAGL